MTRNTALALVLTATSALAACSSQPSLPSSAGFGPSPQLPAPHSTPIPTIKTARPIGWAQGATPTPAPGLAVAAFASGLDHPRWLYVLPNGDVLVAESSSEAGKPKGLRGFAASIIMKNAGEIGRAHV